MKSIIKILTIGAVAAMMAACNDDDIYVFDSPVVDDPSLSGGVDATTVSALTFSWPAVDGVDQYGYTLTSNDGDVVREGVTSDTYLYFTKLSPSTTYILTIEAFGANGATTRRFSMTGTTGDTTSLNAPTGFSMEIVDKNVVITWNAVENADHYTYVLRNSENKTVSEDVTDESTLTFEGLELGDYTFVVYATSDDEVYTQSGSASYLFSRVRGILETKEGTYESYLLGKWTCYMDICDDGVYVIRDFMQVPGYDLELEILNDKSVKIVNYCDESGAFRFVETGLSDENNKIVYIESKDYSIYTFSSTDGKTIQLSTFYPSNELEGGYDYFRWDVPTPEPPTYDYNYVATGSVATYEDWGNNCVAPTTATVESYDGYVIIRALAGVEGYDVKIEIGDTPDSDGEYEIVAITPIKDGEEEERVTSGYANVYTGLEDWYCASMYVGSGYGYAYDQNNGGYVLQGAYFYNNDGTSEWGAYYIEWKEGVEPSQPSGPETVVGQVCKYTADDWGENMVPDCKVNVELYDGYVIVRAVAGIEGYDVQVNFDAETTLVTSITPTKEGEVQDTVTSGYAYVYTGLEDWYCFMPYIGEGYCYAYYDSDSGYVLLSSYFYDQDGNSLWGSYYVEW